MKFTKNILILILLPILLFSFSCGEKEKTESEESRITQTDFSKRYGVKSAIVEYVITGSQSGTKTLYFDKWGMRQAEYTNAVLQVGDFTKNIQLVNIITSDSNFIIDLSRGSGTKTKSPIKKLASELKYQKSFGDFGEQILLKSGAMKVAQEKFLDKDCDVYEIPAKGTRMWIWKWIPLKTVSKLGGVEITSEAKKIETNLSIPEEKFLVPPDIKLTEVDLDDIENQLRQKEK